MRKLKYIICSIILVIFLFSILPINAYADDIGRKNVLVLNSYHYGFEWSDEIVKEIMQVFQTKSSQTMINIEYMDTRRIYNEKYLEELCDIYKYKYSNQDIDLIISSDNNALNFLNKYGKDLFPDTPIVFCGVNDFNQSMINNLKFYTGICENVDIKSNLEIAFKLHPKTKQIAIITDRTSTSHLLRDNLVIQALTLKKDVKLNYIDEISYDVAKSKVLKLPNDTIIFVLGSSFRTLNGEFVSSTEFTKTIFNETTLPIHSLWGFYLNNGIIGGLLTSSQNQGRVAADMAIKILTGTTIADIPIVQDVGNNELVFDNRVLKKYNIEISELPKGSKVINGPEHTFLIRKKTLAVVTIIFIVILIMIIHILSLNIVRRKRMEKALKESEESYRMLVDFMPDAIFVVHNGIIMFSNVAGVKLFGVNQSSEIIGQDILRFVKHDSGSINDKKIMELLSSNSAIPLYQYIILPMDNRETYVESASINIPWDEDEALLFVVRDITERRIAQEIEKKYEENNILLRESMELNAIKTEFFTNMSHELKTPLNVVLSSLQMVESVHHGRIDTGNGEKYRRYTNMMKQNCYRLIRLVDNMIDSTKIETGYIKLSLKNYDIVSIVEDITLSVVKYIEDKGITLLFDTDIEEKVIACDSEKIERIILNLLSNATKFTDEGGCINVNVFDGADKVTISVKDNGVGIPFEKQASIFDRFAMVKDTLSKNPHGSGLGLTIVRSLVEMHGGTIRLESTLNKGTEFIIELPVELVDEDKNPCCDSMGKINDDRINIEFSDI